MKYLFRIPVLMFIISQIFNCNLLAQSTFIQVISEPGISVFLDQVFKGKTNPDLNGLILENVAAGYHDLKVVKEGYNPQVARINVKQGEVFSFTVMPFIPKPKITQTGNVDQQQIDLQVGKIKIQSLPLAISISIPKLGVINFAKSQDEWLYEDVAVGSYLATFTWNNKSLHDTIYVSKDHLTHLFINMIKGVIENRSQILENSVKNEIIESPEFQKPNDKDSYNKENEIPNIDLQAEEIKPNTFRDKRDGKTYRTIQIGTQTWFAENLMVTKFNDGTPIPLVTDASVWKNLSTPGSCWHNVYKNLGVFYNSYTVATGKLCPLSWHVPTDGDWRILVDFLGGKALAGNKMKEKNGFNAIPAGARFGGDFRDLDYIGTWWSATNSNFIFIMAPYKGVFYKSITSSKSDGRSVRCIKD